MKKVYCGLFCVSVLLSGCSAYVKRSELATRDDNVLVIAQAHNQIAARIAAIEKELGIILPDPKQAKK